MVREHGAPPFRVVVVHGGPGAGGEMEPVARELASEYGVLEPIQTATSLRDQVRELTAALQNCGNPPVTIIGFSWGAWLACIVAASRPELVARLILVGSGPFEQEYVAQLRETRLRRLNWSERREFEAITEALGGSGRVDKDRLVARLGALTTKCDSYDPLARKADEAAQVVLTADVYADVWREAVELRRTGELLEHASRVRCPVVAVHGDHDPHPADGVRQPLSAVLSKFRFRLLDRCGHKPWIERHARETFYSVLRAELSHLEPLPKRDV